MKNLEIMLKKYYKLILLIIFLVALTTRFLYIQRFAISFAFDQARDGFVVSEIINGNLKILGPSVSGIPGLYHGVLYYYVILIPYYLGSGDPRFIAYFLSFISSLGVVTIFLLTLKLSKSYIASILSALFFAISYELSQYANLLTNASMGVWFVPLIYLAIIIESPILLGFAFGFSVQSEIALFYHLIPIAILTYKKFSLKKYLLTFIAFLLSISSMILSELKFGFSGLKGVLYLLSGGDGISVSKKMSDYVFTVLNQLSLTFSYNIFPINTVFGGLLGFGLIYYFYRKNNYSSKVLLWYVFAFVLALPFGGWNMRHLLVGLAPAVCVMMGIFISENLFKFKYLLVFAFIIIISLNLFKIVKDNKHGQTIFPLQNDLVLSRELEVVDYTYQNSNGEPFSISTLTSPLFTNTLWSYLYNWYGYKKYGYLPSFVGRDQVGLLGNNLTHETPKNHFYIEESTYGIPEIYVQYARGDENSYSDLLESKSFGELKVEKRIFENVKK